MQYTAVFASFPFSHHSYTRNLICTQIHWVVKVLILQQFFWNTVCKIIDYSQTALAHIRNFCFIIFFGHSNHCILRLLVPSLLQVTNITVIFGGCLPVVTLFSAVLQQQHSSHICYSTLCPLCLSTGSIWSRSSILPLLVTIFSSTFRSNVPCSKGHSNRYGWLQHFLSSIKIFVMRMFTTVPGALVQAAFLKTW